MSFSPRLPRVRLWVKLAAFAAMGVAVTHGVHLALAHAVSSRALARAQESFGRTVARVIAQQAVDAILTNDVLSLHEVVVGATSDKGVSYCFITRGDRVLASSFAGSTPRELLDLRSDGTPPSTPLLVVAGGARYLDVAQPILEGNAGIVRLGMDMSIVHATRARLILLLGLVAAAVIVAGVVTALLVGRRIALPVGELVAAADHFDPSLTLKPIAPRGTDEIADLTERFNRMMVRLKAAHEEQERARQKNMETERLVALGSLVAGVAHEINNPLAGLKNCHHRLQRGDLSEAKRREYLDLVTQALERIEDVVHRLLDFGRPRPLHLGKVFPYDLVRDGASLIRPLLHKRGVELREDLGDVPAEMRVIADRKQISQALLNLIINAAYVTADHGEIRLCTRRRDGLCGVAVEDDGPGIPPSIRERILDPFFTTKPEGEGTGLGLSVTRSIVGAHGGELTFEFPDAGGTVATIWLREDVEPARA